MIDFSYAPMLLKGAAVTLISWAIAGTLSLVIGITLGIISCNYLNFSITQKLVRAYTFVTKGIPAYVQILTAYFVIPSLLNINISGFAAATCALAFCSSGYVTEIIRSGINAVPKGQWDACSVLGYPLKSTLSRIIIPQTIVLVLPTLLGELEQLLKSTSLLATIGVIELTRAGMNIVSRELNPLPVYAIIACVYLLFSAILQTLVAYAQKRINYGSR